MKKIVLFSFFALALVCGQAFADTQAIQDIHTTADNSSTTLKDTFTTSETPWLYVDVPARPDSGSKKLTIDALWFYGLEAAARGTSTFNDGNTADDTQFLQAPLTWSTITQAGDWRVDAVYTWKNGNTINRTGTGSFNFTVTPEPVSMALFGMGAGALGLTSLRRRRLKK